MSSRLEQLVAVVQASVDSARAAASLPALVWRFGHRHLVGESAALRVVWERTSDQRDGVFQSRVGQRARLVLAEGVTAHGFAPNDGDAELLRDQLLLAAHLAGGASLADVSVDWTQPEWLSKGEHFALDLAFKLPVQDAALASAPITAVGFDASDAVQGDGRLDAGEDE
jgi:hypothetical protein